MRNPFERQPNKGLLPKELKSLHKQAKRQEWAERDIRHEQSVPAWSVHNSPLKELFEAGHIKEDEDFEGLGMTSENVKEWVAGQQALGRKIASLDVFGQTRAGLETGVDRAHGWSLADVRPRGQTPDSKESIVEGDIFSSQKRREILSRLDVDRTENAVELGIVFFRPVAGVRHLWGSKFGQTYLYEFVLRPVYERLIEGGMIFIASKFLAGMPMLDDLLKHSDGFELVANEKKTGYMLRKKNADSRLASIGDLREEDRKILDEQFDKHWERANDERIAEIKNVMWRGIRRGLSAARKKLKEKKDTE